MDRYNADGISVCEAHVDMEVFKMRLGKAINYKFNEDARFSLFHRKDPHDGSFCSILHLQTDRVQVAPAWTLREVCLWKNDDFPRLTISVGLNKVEKVALRFANRRNRPLVLVIKNIHLFEDNAKGHERIVQLQQKAETWADSGKKPALSPIVANSNPSGVATIVFTSYVPPRICEGGAERT